MFRKNKSKLTNLKDFSVMEVSSGQVDMMIKYLKDRYGWDIDYDFKNNNGVTRCYLTSIDKNEYMKQYFDDRTSSQIEDIAKSFELNA